MIGRSRIPLILLLLVGVLALSCRSGDSASRSRRRAARQVTLVVENDHFLDVTVFAVGTGADLRLGEVTGKTHGTFTIDPQRVSMASGLRFRVDPIGSNRNYLSPAVFPDGAITVTLTVASELELSHVTVR